MVDDELFDFVPVCKKSARPRTHLRLIADGIAWGAFLVLLACGVPRVEAIFADFGVPLPNLTMFVIEASHLAIAVLTATVILLVADWFVMTRFSGRGDIAGERSWSLLMIATPVVMVALTLWALILPFLTITVRLSG